MQVFISSGPDWHAINDENYDDFSGIVDKSFLGYKPLLWDGENVYIGDDTQTHGLLCKEFGIKYNWDDRNDMGYFTQDLGIEWLNRPGGRKVFEPAPGVNDAILEALGGTNTFMSKRLGSGYAAPEGARSNARRGIELVNQGEAGDGLEPATVTRAHSIAEGKPLTPDHIQRMHSFFERHDKTRPDDGGKGNSPWKTAWLLWGGDAGRSWANSMYHKINGGSDKTSGWNDVMQWPLDWASEKKFDVE